MKKKIYSAILSLYFLLNAHLATAFATDWARYSRFGGSYDDYDGPPLSWQDMALAFPFVIGILACMIYSWKKEEELEKRLAQIRKQRK